MSGCSDLDIPRDDIHIDSPTRDWDLIFQQGKIYIYIDIPTMDYVLYS
jgi:hypothetical protein